MNKVEEKIYLKSLEDSRPYPESAIPSWCGMSWIDHLLVGGCWGIAEGWASFGLRPKPSELVKVPLEDYCSECEFYPKEDE